MNIQHSTFNIEPTPVQLRHSIFSHFLSTLNSSAFGATAPKRSEGGQPTTIN
jgi:hypothetical protein